MFKRIILLSSILIVACVNVAPLVNPNSTINIYGVTAKPPQTGNWVVVASSGYQSSMASKGVNDNESLAVNTSIFQLAELSSEEDFLEYVVSSRAATPKTGRFENKQNNENLSSLNGAVCVKYHSISEDKNAKIAGGTASMLLESIGYNCQHPLNKTVGVNVEYSSRYFQGSQNHQLSEHSSEYFNNVQFTEF